MYQQIKTITINRPEQVVKLGENDMKTLELVHSKQINENYKKTLYKYNNYHLVEFQRDGEIEYATFIAGRFFSGSLSHIKRIITMMTKMEKQREKNRAND